MDIGKIFGALRPKFTRWDCVSLAIFGVLAYIGNEGFSILSCSFGELVILITVLFTISVALLVLEPALKRLWSKTKSQA